MHCLFLLFVIALGQNSSGGNGQDNLQFGELSFTETSSQDLNFTRMKINLRIEVFQNLTNGSFANDALNQVVVLITEIKQALSEFISIEALTTTEMNIIQLRCDNSTNLCLPQLAPTQAPEQPNQNGSQPGNQTLPGQPSVPPPPPGGQSGDNNTQPGQPAHNCSQHNGHNGINQPGGFNNTQPGNGTQPGQPQPGQPQPGQPQPQPGGNGTQPQPGGNGTQPQPGGNVTQDWTGMATRVWMGFSFEANITESQQIIQRVVRLGAPWVFLDAVSFAASETDLQVAKTGGVHKCLLGLRDQAEEHLSKLQLCFVNWRRIIVRDLSDYRAMESYHFYLLSQLFTEFSQMNSASSSPSSYNYNEEQVQSLKVSCTAVARFEECNNTGNGTSTGGNGGSTGGSTGGTGGTGQPTPAPGPTPSP